MKLFRKLKKGKSGSAEGGLSETASLRAALPTPHSTTPSQPPTVPQPSTSAPPAAIKVQPSSDVCQTCFHLDPTRAPQDGNPAKNDPSWAVDEYMLPPDTPAARLTPKSEDVIRSAGNGCMHCFMVRSALGAVYPTWETEETVLTLFLAVGVPVVVRMEFGKYVETTISREDAMQMYGYDVPVKIMISLIDPTKEKLEVEIYRPVGESQGGNETAYDLSSLVEHMGVAEDIPNNSGSEASLNFVKHHVEDCVGEHQCGAKGEGLPLLPDRVIWVRSDILGGIQLVEPKGTVRAKYIALSYCWGPVSPTTYLTNAENLPSRKSGIGYNDLPLLLRDVVSIARALGIDYVWVDRLCIVQGPGGDFAQQAPKMGDIYGNASLTIAAASGTSENDRILFERTTQGAGPFTLNLNLQSMGTLTLKIRRRTHRLGTEKDGGDYGRVSTRAWIWQERLLSSRTVFFTASALKFECRSHSVWQGYGPNTRGHSWSTHINLGSLSHDSWLRLVMEFMHRKITQPSDRLPAIESVMRHIVSRTGWKPIYGVFQEHLIPSLCWEAHGNRSATGKYPCRMNPAHYAPTWSWASVEGLITYLHVLTDGAYAPIQHLDPKSYELQCQGVDYATGTVTLVGRYVIGGVKCTVKPADATEEDQDGAAGTTQTYEVRVSGRHEDSRFEPDVPLMPHGGDSQPYTPSVVRVPYGAELPLEEWTGNCIVLLVATQKKKSLALVLGRSLRAEGVWEKIGLATGIDMGVWGEEHVKRGLVKVC
ncbi:heterokaryon incompatibility protein-domain-containing protein [Immersiella caudata]|uniref:Heterokaryon incompatibility protein-domain-containing protein n=1 Tax=Immersiella caudata TaxID=314043 RepID=A0AA39WA10_9PEZI|nr:heterokaryon incompatibility protein-domain-containing protein [Immersiella caudata]